MGSDLHTRSIVRVTEEKSKLANGPYVIDSGTGHVHAVSKLFEDGNDAFVGGVLPRSCSKAAYQWLRSTNVSSNFVENRANTDPNRKEHSRAIKTLLRWPDK